MLGQPQARVWRALLFDDDAFQIVRFDVGNDARGLPAQREHSRANLRNAAPAGLAERDGDGDGHGVHFKAWSAAYGYLSDSDRSALRVLTV